MNFFISFSNFIIEAADYLWNGPILVTLLLGGGIYFSLRSKLTPILFFRHSLKLLSKRSTSQKGISSFESVSSQIAGIVGMGNISGVAVAISLGGPGAIFWMWVTAFLGMITKFYTCSLSVLYRRTSNNKNFGGPMYVIVNGLGERWKFLATVFCFFGLLGVSPIFQSNQIVEVINSVIIKDNFLFGNKFYSDLFVGISISILVSFVILGGIKRIGLIAGKIVPFMVVLYLSLGLLIIIKNLWDVPSIFKLILQDAFTGEAVVGGLIGEVIRQGIRRAAFSNEAGLGTEVLAHGAAKTREPVREGLVAMLGPFIDTIVVCTITALIILISGVYTEELNGVSMTAAAFQKELGIAGEIFLTIAVLTFAFSTMFGYSYYGQKCTSHLFGTKWRNVYNWFYVIMIVFASMSSIDIAVNFVDSAYALMVIPTMISTFMLAPKVMEEANKYFRNL